MQMQGAMELVRSIRKIDNLHTSYGTPEAEPTYKLVFKSILWTPYVLWKLRNMGHVKPIRFWFTNRNNQAIEGVMYGLDDKEQKPIVAYDCGYKRGRSNFPTIGKLIACLGYRAVSILSREELKAMEADDYTDALSYLRLYSQYKQLFGVKTAFVVISGGCNVLYRSCSSQKFVDENRVVCGVAVAGYADLAKQFAYMKKKIEDPNIDPNTKRVLVDYNNYATRIGLTPDADPEIFRLGSPLTYAPDMKIPLMLVHGERDPIVPPEGSIEIFKIMRAVKKRVKLVLTPGEGVHGNSSKWRTSLTELAGVLATLGYAYRYLRNRFND